MFFYHQYFNFFFFFICKACRIMFMYILLYMKKVIFFNILLNSLWKSCHQNIIIFSLLRQIVLITIKQQMFLTCLITNWQTEIIQLYKHRNLKGSGTWSVLLESKNISDCIESIYKLYTYIATPIFVDLQLHYIGLAEHTIKNRLYKQSNTFTYE